jgi:hypothetical protein
MKDLDLPLVARRAYDAYAMKTGGRTYEGHNMASWPDLPERVREAWVASVAAALDLALDQLGLDLATDVEVG